MKNIKPLNVLLIAAIVVVIIVGVFLFIRLGGNEGVTEEAAVNVTQAPTATASSTSIPASTEAAVGEPIENLNAVSTEIASTEPTTGAYHYTGEVVSGLSFNNARG
jgi:flagellar basal body-associated protein FliL